MDRFNSSRKQVERTGRNSTWQRHREDRLWSKSRNNRSSVFFTHCRKTGHEISDCWSIKRKENGRRFERNTGRSDSNRSPKGNQINVADTRSGEILSLEDSTIGEVHYSAQDAHMWLLDSSATFHVTPNLEWFSYYATEMSGTVPLGNEQECKIVGIGEVPIQLPNGNTITLHQVRHVPALKKETYGLHRHASQRWVYNGSQWVGMDDYPRKSSNWKWAQVQQPIPTDSYQSRRACEYSRKNRPKPMVRPTRPYVASRTWSANDGRLHSETTSKDGLRRALSIRETDPKSALSPLQDGTTPPRTNTYKYMWADAREITRRAASTMVREGTDLR